MRRTRGASQTRTAPAAISATFSTLPVCTEATATASDSKRKNRTTWSARRSNLIVVTSLPPLAQRVEGAAIASRQEEQPAAGQGRPLLAGESTKQLETARVVARVRLRLVSACPKRRGPGLSWTRQHSAVMCLGRD